MLDGNSAEAKWRFVKVLVYARLVNDVGAQIPHLRVMGRNIRFLKSDLQLFRAQFRQEVENATTE